MKPWIKRTLFGLLGAGILVGGITACSHHSEGMSWQMSTEDHAKFRDKIIDRVASKLELNADQKKRLGALADKVHEQHAAVMSKTPDPRAEMQALVAGDKFDRARAQALITEKTAAVNARSPEVIAALADFYDSLNPTQQAKVREFMQHRHGWLHRG